MNMFVSEEMPKLYLNNSDEFADYLQEVGDHILKNDCTYHCYINDKNRFVYYANNYGETNDYLTINGLCRRMGITFPTYLGQDQRKPYKGIKRFKKKRHSNDPFS